MKLLLDLGNTRLKWAWQHSDNTIHSVHALAWGDDLSSLLRAIWPQSRQPVSVWGASVVDTKRENIVASAVQFRFGLEVKWMQTPRESCGVTCAYEDPSSMGVDRFLGLVAAHTSTDTPCVLISSGTALVLDAITRDGQHMGGLIAPGGYLMQQCVQSATVKVRPVSSGLLTDVATNTADALTSGCWQACAALSDRFIGRIEHAVGETPRVLLGGGDAGLLKSMIEHKASLFPDAVLRGLAQCSEA